MANIRSKFKGDKTLDGYQKKKYVCKLLFIFLLGHDIDFGHMEAVNLLSSNKYTEKQIVSQNASSSPTILFTNIYYSKYRYLGLSFHLCAGKYQQRFDPLDHSEHKEWPSFTKSDSCQFGTSMHCQYWEQRNGRNVRYRNPETACVGVYISFFYQCFEIRHVLN